MVNTKYDYITRKVLENLLYNENLTHKLIAKRLNTSEQTIWRKCKKFEIIPILQRKYLICTKCKLEKPKNEFKTGKQVSRKCQKCRSKESVLRSRKYNRTFEGHIRVMYSRMLQRLKRDRYYSKFKNIIISKEDFILLAKTSKEYKKLFLQWRKFNFSMGFTPTPDRINNNIGYLIDNIRFLAQRDNSSRKCGGAACVYIGVYEYRGVYKNLYKYLAHFTNKRIKYRCGYYKTELEAAQAVDRKCIELEIPQKNNTIKKPK